MYFKSGTLCNIVRFWKKCIFKHCSRKTHPPSFYCPGGRWLARKNTDSETLAWLKQIEMLYEGVEKCWLPRLVFADDAPISFVKPTLKALAGVKTVSAWHNSQRDWISIGFSTGNCFSAGWDPFLHQLLCWRQKLKSIGKQVRTHLNCCGQAALTFSFLLLVLPTNKA